jgi:tetratricopeptide (TPR) repeat protein
MRLDAARIHFEKALRLRQSRHDEWGIGNSLLNLAAVEYRTKAFDLAQQYTDRALAIANKIRDHWFTARCKTAKAVLLSDTGQIQQARNLHEENLKTFEAIGNVQGRIEASNGLGVVDYQMSDFIRAIGWFEESLRLARLRGDQRSVAICLSNLGACHYELKHYNHAREALESAALAWEVLGTPENAAMMRQQLADIEAEQSSGTGL